MLAKSRRARVVRALLAVSVVVGAAAGAALAANAVMGEDEVLYACAQEQTGVLRLVDDPAECRASERSVEWNVQGPPGSQGPKGDAGPKGDPGELGSLGDLEGLTCTVNSVQGATTWFAYPTPSSYAYNTPALHCLIADRYEPNDDRAHAVDITSDAAPPLPGAQRTVGGITLYPAGDHDWYALPNRELTSIGTNREGVTLEIYRDGELVATVTTTGPWANTVPGSHNWIFHFTATGSGKIMPFDFAVQ